MRQSALFAIKNAAICVLLLAMAGAGARAQYAYTGDDWTLDRGSATVDTLNNGLALRQGYNAFTDSANNPLHAVRRWVWPATADIAAQTGSVGGNYSLSTDNYNPNDLPANKVVESNGQQAADAIAVWNGNDFGIPVPANRVPYGGFSYITDPTNANSFDYGVAVPVLQNIEDGNGNAVSATTLEALPYVTSDIYSNVQKALVADDNNTAEWSMGTPTLPTLTANQYVKVEYEVQVWSPGDGTITQVNGNNVVHPDLQHAFVRVSWNNTVVGGALNYGSGAAGAGGINDPDYSRIFMVNLSGGPGWRTVGAYASGNQTAAVQPALFPYLSSTPGNQLVVSLYRLTPDNPNDTTIYTNPPLVTADAVRFVPVSVQLYTNGVTPVANTTNMGPISAIGRILAPVVSSKNVATGLGVDANDPSANQNIWFAAREETIPTTTTTIVDPTQTNLTANNDPFASQTAPVFYCLSNVDEAVGAGTTITNLPSISRVRWRYVATPDAGTGTCIASPLLANVRCRDGVVRPMVYFVTTNASGSLGHIYALDPLGNNPFDNFDGKGVVDPGDLSTRTTNAYWVYPSVRWITNSSGGITTTVNGTNAPPNAPAGWDDPNYTVPLNLGGYSRTGYPTATFGADQAIPYYDGDIVTNTAANAATTPYVTRTDTQITLGGMAWAPILVNDPSNTAGAQELIVGSQAVTSSNTLQGRLWAFDAGGRGDFGTINVTEVDNNVTPVTTTTATIPTPGTTQRLWTWPHFGADAFHRVNGDTAGGYTQTFNIPDETPIGLISGSPTFDPNYPGTEQPVMFGTSDGRVYAVLPYHDSFQSINANNQAVYDNSIREYWTYPGISVSGLGAGISSLATFVSSKTSARYLVFTSDLPDGSGGRVYEIPEATVTGPLGSQVPATAGLTWVYPPSTNPPAVDPNNPNTTAPLAPGFGPSAPIVVNSTTVNVLSANLIPYDMVYAVQNDGTVDAIEADPAGDGNGTTPLLYSTSPAFTNTTTCTPTATQIIAQQGMLNNTPLATVANNSFPAVMFADDGGAISAIGMNAIDDGTGTGTTLLPALWQYSDSSTSRIATASLSNGYIVEGDEGGQLRAYSNGLGNGTTETVPPSEALGNSTDATIDLRLLDYYAQPDWKNFMQPAGTAGAETPAVGTTGNYLGARPIGSTQLPRNGVPADWGDTLYLAAWGVYHAQPEGTQAGTGKIEQGLTPPRITVTFRVLQPGSARSVLITVPAELTNAANNGWPADTAALGTNFSIAGWDNTLQAVQLLTGPTQNVFPWVATYSLVIKPDAQNPFTPGLAGVRVAAQAHIQQTILIQQQGQPNVTEDARRDSEILRAGQHDYVGFTQTDGNGNWFAGTPNNRALRGRARPVFITNPLALTTAGTNPANTAVGINNVADNTGTPETMGWAGSVQLAVNNLQDLFGNGASVGYPGTIAYKALLAPLDLVPDGSSVTYQGLNSAGARVPALYAMDRSAYYEVTGNALRYQVNVPQFNWYGGSNAVMNPLPWETMPGNGVDSADYPAIPSTAVKVTDPSGANVVVSNGVLTPPTQPAGDPNVADRILSPVPLTLQLNVPKYQPANVNAGIATFNGVSIGDSYTDIAGTVLGAAGNPVYGPMLTYGNGGLSTNINAASFPALGYVGQNFQVNVVLPGQVTNLPPNGFRRAAPSRDFTSTVCVAPDFKMKIAQGAIDLGSEPAGAGYSSAAGGTYSLPFEPTGVGAYTNSISPWDGTATNQIGKYFQPFTLQSDSNVNLVDLRIAKLFGLPGAAINGDSLATSPYQTGANGVAVSARMQSDEVDQTLSPWLLATPFGLAGSNASGPGLGNIGLVSSFDHASLSDSQTSAVSLYPIPGAAWPGGQAPYPSLHKPLPGDPSGTIATVPDVPHNYTGVQLPSPEIGVAVPYGTPVGTYTGRLIAYEDELPIQWQAWLSTLRGSTTGLPVNNDGILNTSSISAVQGLTDPTGTVNAGILEPVSNAVPIQVKVIENRLTNGVTPGSLSQMDLVNPLLAFTSASGGQPGPYNTSPALAYVPGGTNQATAPSNLVCFWSSSRNTAAGTAQENLDASQIVLPYAVFSYAGANGQTQFVRGDAVTAGGTAVNTQWWSTPQQLLTLTSGLATTFFPSTGDSGISGTPSIDTLRFADPAVTQTVDVNSVGAATTPGSDPLGYIFYRGQVDKSVGGQQSIDHRLLYQTLNGATPQGTPIAYPNDPSLPAATPVPVALNFTQADAARGTSAQQMVYVFYGTGSAGAAHLYYNVNAYTNNGATLNAGGTPVTTDGWITSGAANDPRLGAQVLPLPAAVTSATHPTVVYRQVVVHNPFDPANPQDLRRIDCLDVYFSGKVRGRSGVRLLMVRFGIYRGENYGSGMPVMKMGQLFVVPLPPVVSELAEQHGDANTWAGRDSGWYTGVPSPIVVQLEHFDSTTSSYSGLINLNAPAGSTVPAQGQFDPASGDIFYQVLSTSATTGATVNNTNGQPLLQGGAMVVNPGAGTVSFPNIAPSPNDRLLVSYIPEIRDLSVARNDSNIIPGGGYGAYGANIPATLLPQVWNRVTGDAFGPVATMDTSANPRQQYTAPAVVFSANGQYLPPSGGIMPVDRLWVVYRKTDLGGAQTQGLFVKALRLMVRLPYPVWLTAPDANGNQQIQSLTMTVDPSDPNQAPLNGPYEVDWARGRIYFTTADAGRIIDVSYTGSVGGGAGNSGKLVYRIAWGDEVSTNPDYEYAVVNGEPVIQDGTGNTVRDVTTPETSVPMAYRVNVGQVAAMADPIVSRLWLFWSGTAFGSTDLYQEAYAPRLYPDTPSQH